MNQRFLVCMKQKGIGCDYTIACGKDYKIIEAPYRSDVEKKIIEEYGIEDEYGLEEILIVCINDDPDNYVDIPKYLRKMEQEKVDEEEQKERAELERLKAKYEGGNNA